jgi:alpha-L-fucosidase
MSHSFGFNRADTDADYESVETLVHSFIDTVAKNGNLLLNVGPRGEDAQIPAPQIARLRGFGEWLRANGEGTYGTRPWTRAQGQTPDGLGVRFAAKDSTLYIHLLATPKTGDIIIEGSDLPAVARATHLASGSVAECARTSNGLRITLPGPLAPAPAHGFALTA